VAARESLQPERHPGRTGVAAGRGSSGISQTGHARIRIRQTSLRRRLSAPYRYVFFLRSKSTDATIPTMYSPRAIGEANQYVTLPPLRMRPLLKCFSNIGPMI